ncbi:MAG: hypothetical protein A4E55_01751 [Pelotomaculum sp. PtaU1.Bin035]|nr:MAG: hypothetical protein A4E55_01751 [Pelotomaculum sp. PtaU1.Bin035]
MKSILPNQYEIEKQFNSRVDKFYRRTKLEKYYALPTFIKKRDLAVFTFSSSFFYLSLTARTFIVHCKLKVTSKCQRKMRSIVF